MRAQNPVNGYIRLFERFQQGGSKSMASMGSFDDELGDPAHLLAVKCPGTGYGMANILAIHVDEGDAAMSISLQWEAFAA